MNEQGVVYDVRVHRAGAQLASAAAVGATTLYVEDAADFDPNGGQLVITTGDTTGSTVNSYSYSAIDLDLDTITLSAAGPVVAAADAGDSVDVWPLVVEKQASVVLLGTEEAVTAKVNHALSDLLPEGIREGDTREFVTLQLVGGTWMLTDVIGKEPSIQAPGYTEGQSGWLLDPSSTQFENANVIGTIGAGVVTADTIQLGDQDLQGDILSPLAGGVVAFANVATGVGTAAVTTTETIMFEFNAGKLQASHVYYILCHGHLQGSQLNDAFDLQLRYTNTGSSPTLTSGVIDGSTTRVNYGGTISSTAFALHGIYYLPNAADPDPLRLALTLQRATTSGGGGNIYMTSADRSLQFWVFDMGARDQLPGSIAQISKTTGTADAAPTASYTKSWTCLNSKSFDEDNHLRAGDETGWDMYQGYYSTTHGNTKSIGLFDDANIRSTLSGATVTKVTLTIRVKHSYLAAGLKVRVRSHNYSTMPSTYAAGPNIMSKDNVTEGSTVTLQLPTSFGTDLKNGVTRGIGFGAPANDNSYYGYMYGSGSDTPPKLTITYTK
jgi:hypothetical protein